MQQNYCIKAEGLRKAQGAFLLAKKMGLIEDPSKIFFSTGVFAV